MTTTPDVRVFASCFSGNKEDKKDEASRIRTEKFGQNAPYDLSELGKVTKIYMDTDDALKKYEGIDDYESFIYKAKKGVAVIIVNKNFNDNMNPERKGADKDFSNMVSLFRDKLQYKVFHLYDGTTQELQEFLTKVTSNKQEMKEADCVMVVVSSHGSESPSVSSNYHPYLPKNIKTYDHFICTNDGKLKTIDIMDKFDEYHCRELKKKPKFFFIQACRAREGKPLSESLDRGVVVETEDKKLKINPAKFFAPPSPSAMDVKHTKPEDFKAGGVFYTDVTGPKIALEEEVHLSPPPCYHNCMVVMASPSEHVAWSETDTGGWLLYSLYQVLSNYIRNGHAINVLQAVTEISHMMALSMQSNTDELMYNMMKCVPSTTHMLLQDIILIPPQTGIVPD